MALFTYRGRKVRPFYQHIKGITYLILWSPFLVALGTVAYFQYDQIFLQHLLYGLLSGTYLLIISTLVLLVNVNLYRKSLFFQKLNSLRILARFLIENNYYLIKRVKRENKVVEKRLLPNVYIKQTRHNILVSLILEGNKFQDRFLNLGATLEVMFNGDYRNKTFEGNYVQYEIAINRIDSRISIEDVVVTGSKIQLMEDVTWDYIEEPHLLIGGGTGGGKTILLMTLLYALAKIGFVDICDPKRSDLTGLKNIPVFHRRVYSSKDTIINCFRENVAFMEKRYELMASSPRFQAGKNFTHYGMKPKFVLVDELAALMAEIDRDYALQSELVECMSQLILKGRQAGVIVIVAMQRPDGEYIKTALRDNFMKRLSVGHLEAVGYDMMFGDANKNKEFKKLDTINGVKVRGRGYIATNGELAGEFFSPLVPLDQGFSFYEAYAQIPIMEFEGEEFDIFEEETAEITPFEIEESTPIEEDLPTGRSLKEFVEEKELTISTVRKLVYKLEKAEMAFERKNSSILVEPFQEEALLAILKIYEEEGGSYDKAVETYLASNGREQGQGQA